MLLVFLAPPAWHCQVRTQTPPAPVCTTGHFKCSDKVMVGRPANTDELARLVQVWKSLIATMRPAGRMLGTSTGVEALLCCYFAGQPACLAWCRVQSQQQQHDTNSPLPHNAAQPNSAWAPLFPLCHQGYDRVKAVGVGHSWWKEQFCAGKGTDSINIVTTEL